MMFLLHIEILEQNARSVAFNVVRLSCLYKPREKVVIESGGAGIAFRMPTMLPVLYAVQCMTCRSV